MKKQRIEPGPGQESVWDYPRPPKIEACKSRIEVIVGDTAIASTSDSYRVLETSHPPVYYLPPDSVKKELLRQSNHGSFCEWKGRAYYYSLMLPDRVIENIAWAYKSPTQRFLPIEDYLAFYPSLVDACYVDGERVQAQVGDFYGGWITSKIVGPFKGGPGTMGW